MAQEDWDVLVVWNKPIACLAGPLSLEKLVSFSRTSLGLQLKPLCMEELGHLHMKILSPFMSPGFSEAGGKPEVLV